MCTRPAVRLISAAVLLLAGSLFTLPATARAAEECFPETNQCIQEPFLDYWRDHGGLAIHGYPISDRHPERFEFRTPDGRFHAETYEVQYFERSRFEWHPENAGTPHEVLLGQFGRVFYLTDPNYPHLSAAEPLPGATYFDATGHNLSGRFRQYWQEHGGLAQFGYPISEELRERLEDGKTYTVQYFERARLELHPENAPPHDVLLGQFGRRILAAQAAPGTLPFPVTGVAGQQYSASSAVRARLGLPTGPAATEIPGTVQIFEGGVMIWNKEARTIDVFIREAYGGSTGLSDYAPIGAWRSYPDTWDESQPVGGGQAAPDRWEPSRGFGKLWRENATVRQQLGYAVSATETPLTLTMQPFAGGMTLVADPGCTYQPGDPVDPWVCRFGGTGLFILYTNGRFERPFLRPR